MNIDIHRESMKISVSACEIARFARTKKSAKRVVFTENENSPKEGALYARPLKVTVNEGTLAFDITGSADLLWEDRGLWTLEIIKEQQKITSASAGEKDAHFFARGVLLSYMLCEEKDLSHVKLRLTLSSPSGTLKTTERVFERGFLTEMSRALLERAYPFIAAEVSRRVTTLPSLATLPFPYPSLRDAQKDFINDAYRAIKRGDRLLVCAPTGIGKTMSALYPALRALGKGEIDRIFYLTAKTVTGKAAEDGIKAINRTLPSLRSVTVMAKERTCPMASAPKRIGMNPCVLCPLMGEVGRLSYEERRDRAVLSLIEAGGAITADMIKDAAQKNELCPYELSLDISEYCEVIICDYNYVFDPSVRFKRYFSQSREKYAFLVDEAHNLPDRAREMYSADLSAKPFLRLYKTDDPIITKNTPLLDAVTGFIKKLREVNALCKSEEHLTSSGESFGYYLSSRLPQGLWEAVLQFARVARSAAKNDEAAAELLEESIAAADSFAKSAALFDRGFAFYAELSGPYLSLQSRCLDPSPMLSQMLLSAKSTIMFSATLTPMEYFADVLGCKDAALLELDSPYSKKNLCLFACDHVSTRYEDREMSIPDIAEIILATVEAREGNYMVYFPSYEYMRQVYEEFSECAPYLNTAVQSSKMSHRERIEFLSRFTPDGEPTVGFCVLGGAFSEGVDLKGDSLIGAIIVGTGLPKLSSQQNILADHFEKTREGGYDYAYTYPGMIKVLQAAGRVIRSENDRGVVVLIDDRYAKPEIYRLFPKAWSHIKYTGDAYSLSASLEKFWESFDRDFM